MTVAELLNKLAVKAGIKPDNEALKTLLSSSSLNIEAPAEVADGIEAGLLTVASAKANTELKNHFFALHRNGVDAEIKRVMDELGLDDATKAELLHEDISTSKRAGMLARKVKELEEAKASAKGGDKAELQKQINDLNAAKASLVKDHQAALDSVKSEYEGKLTNKEIESALSGYKYVFPEGMSQRAKITAARAALDEALSASKAKIVNENGTLRLTKEDGTDYYNEKQEKLDFKAFVDSTLSSNKLLATADTDKKEGGGNKTNPTIGGKQGATNRSVLGDLDAEIEAASGFGRQ